MLTRVSNDQNEMDIDLIHSFLSACYWSAGIPRPVLVNAMRNSLCFALLLENDESAKKAIPATEKPQTIGFARMVTDKATFAYLADVFIVNEFRNKGYSQILLDAIFAHADIQGLRRIMLATRDAHGLYEKYNFSEIPDPSILMQIHSPNIYQ